MSHAVAQRQSASWLPEDLPPHEQDPRQPVDHRSVSFIVPVRNDAHGLKRCLRSIRGQSEAVEIIVADNGSTDGSPQVARSFGATVLELPNLSISALRNRAAEQTHASLLAFIDADMELHPGWLNAAISAFEREEVAAVGAEYSIPTATTWVQRLYDGMRRHRPGINDTRWLASGNMVVRRTTFEHLKGFDETLRTCEDWDFCTRVHLAGGRLLSDSRLQSVHYGDPATLGALFLGELWRGRDNLKVSLRSVLSWRDLPSIVFPMLWLMLAVSAIVGLALTPAIGKAAALVSLVSSGMIVCLAALRGAVIWRRARGRHAVTLAQVFVFAAVYDAARALSLIVDVKHRRARGRSAGTSR